MDSIFCGLPAPKPAPQTGAPIDMSVYHNASAGCFHGQCTVRLMNGSTTLVKNIKPGDRIAPHGGTVNYVVKTKCSNNKAKMIVVSFHIDFSHLMVCFFIFSSTTVLLLLLGIRFV